MSTEVGAAPSTSASPSKEKAEAHVKAHNLLAQGKRNLVCQEIPTAVQQFQDACQLLSGAYGEMAKECADAYFQYGSALLELARMEQGVLGNALDGVDVDAEDEASPKEKEQFEPTDKLEDKDRDDLREKVYDAMSEEERAKKENEAKKDATESKSETMEVDAENKDSKSNEAKSEGEKKVLAEQDLNKVEAENVAIKKDFGEDKKVDAAKKDGEKEAKKEDEKMDDKEGDKEEKTGDAEKKGDDATVKKDEKESAAEETKDEPKESSKDKTEGVAEKDKKESKAVKDKTEGEADKKEGEEEEDDEEGDEDEEESQEECESQEEGEKKEGEENPDDISNLQLAWEVLELSKVIYSKDESKDMQLKAAESSLKLGEVSLETEQYDAAIADLENCLKIQKEHLEAEDRGIAETHYQLGLACQMNKQFEKAIDSFKAAVDCLEKKIVKLQIVVKEKPAQDKSDAEPGKFEAPAEMAAKEIKEIESILPEIREKVTDAQDEMKTVDDLKTMAKEAIGSAFSAVAGSTTETGFGTASSKSSSKSPMKSTEEKKSMDISHLIRKKRKPDEETTTNGDVEIKKAKQEGASGDAPKQNGTDAPKTNGHAEKSEATPAPEAMATS